MLKKRAKDLIVILIIAIVLTVAILALDIKSVDEYYNESLDKITDTSKVAYLSIDCKTVLSNMDKLKEEVKDFIPSNGVILEKKPYAIKSGDTAFTILQRIAKHNKISLSYSGNNQFNSIYVEGINHLFEKDCGGESGWIVLVNGKMLKMASDKYVLKEGDYVEWRYSCVLGDVGVV